MSTPRDATCRTIHPVPSATDVGSDVAIREVRPSGAVRGQVLLVGSYGMPTGAAFDIDGMSFMQELADNGLHAWAIDLVGYGAAGRPTVMAHDPQDASAFGRAEESADDLDAAVRYVVERTGSPQVDVIGWSWGGVVAGSWAARRPASLRRLVLLASPYAFDNPDMAAHFASAVLPAYDVVSIPKSVGQWESMLAQVPAPLDRLVEPDAIPRVAEALKTCDPGFADDGSFRRPNGPKMDLARIWRDEPVYDLAAVAVPTLSIHGTHDPFVDTGQLARMSRDVTRREVVVAEATHYLLFERCRHVVSDEIGRFLLDAAAVDDREEARAR